MAADVSSTIDGFTWVSQTDCLIGLVHKDVKGRCAASPQFRVEYRQVNSWLLTVDRWLTTVKRWLLTSAQL